MGRYAFPVVSRLLHRKRKPEEYFEEVKAKHPGALASQWIPQDRALWRIDRYPDFLEARRDLLANAANAFLDQSRSGSTPDTGRLLERQAPVVEDLDDCRDRATALINELVELVC
jgi:hypothetical protein